MAPAVLVLLGLLESRLAGGRAPACTAPAPSPSARPPLLGLPRASGPGNALDNLPRRLPPWPPTYNLSLSTTMYAQNATGPWDVALTQGVGLVIMAIGQIPGYWGSHAEQKAEASCRQQKALNPASRCTVYYNTELGMEWDDSQKEVMTVEHQDLWLQVKW